mmetsp:Transcript_10965/g.11008  ORF Transcript_10965/g.11008 Transcript_10965/m.11008 type:complete len:138 (+) Transcript_10965:149-562(+)
MEALNILQLSQQRKIVNLTNKLEKNEKKTKDLFERISADYKKDLEIRDALINQQQEAISSLQRDISSLQETNSSLQETISSLQQQNSKILIRIESQEFLIDRMNDEIRQLSDDFFKMKESLSDKIAVLQSEIIRLKK